MQEEKGVRDGEGGGEGERTAGSSLAASPADEKVRPLLESIPVYHMRTSRLMPGRLTSTWHSPVWSKTSSDAWAPCRQ